MEIFKASTASEGSKEHVNLGKSVKTTSVSLVEGRPIASNIGLDNSNQRSLCISNAPLLFVS